MTNFDSLAGRAHSKPRACAAPTYADVRFEEQRSERIEVRNGDVVTLADETSTGYGIRAFCDGAWGFASSPDLSDAGVDAAAALATRDRAKRERRSPRAGLRRRRASATSTRSQRRSNAIRKTCRTRRAHRALARRRTRTARRAAKFLLGARGSICGVPTRRSTARPVRASRSRCARPAAGWRRSRSATAMRSNARFPATSASTNPAVGRSSNAPHCAKTRHASAKKRWHCSTRRNVPPERSTSSWAARKSRCRSMSRADMPPNSTASWAGKQTSRERAFSTRRNSVRCATVPTRSRS